MPVAGVYTIRDVLKACDLYFAQTGRRVTFEYCLINQINDRPAHARELAGLLRGRAAHVNLIPVNPTPENHYGATIEQDVETFQQILEREGIITTRRRDMGRDISGACGQLVRRKF